MFNNTTHNSFELSEQRNSITSLFSTELCQMILNPAQGGVWIVNLDGYTIYANASMARMIGYSVEEMLGQSFLVFMDAESKTASSQNFENRKQGKSDLHKFRLKHKNGSDVWILAAANPLRDQQGLIIASLGLVTELGAVVSLLEDTNHSIPTLQIEKNKNTCIQLENLILEPKTVEVRVNTRTIELSAFRFKLLRYFLENANRLIPRLELLAQVWEDLALNDRVIDAHIVSLRKKLRGFHGEFKTIYGVGHILKTHTREKH